MTLEESTLKELEEIRSKISGQTRIAVLTGAGISAASGIPTFRGAQDSLWSNYRPEELATMGAFTADPELVWKWYDWRRGLIAESRFNAAHQALAELENMAQVVIVTQNVDGYHQDAGSTTVHEFHGSIWQVRCLDCHRQRLDKSVPIAIPPICTQCGGMERPGVVWFGEGIDPQVMAVSFEAANNCDLFLVVGTAGAVYPAASLVEVAKDAGAKVLEFNLEPSGITHLADVFVPGDASETMGLLLP